MTTVCDDLDPPTSSIGAVDAELPERTASWILPSLAGWRLPSSADWRLPRSAQPRPSRSAQPRPPRFAPEGALRGRAVLPRIRPLWYVELLLIVVGDRIYELTRNMVPTDKGLAVGHGRTLEQLESLLHINFGLALNRFVAAHEWIAQGMNYYYATLHFVITVGLLIWLYLARPLHYRRFRTILAIITFLGLAGFYLYPLAPPRLIPQYGYVDTVVVFRTWGSWSDPTIAAHSNQYAAMPSLHTAWALWSALVVVTLARHTWVKAVAAAYPLATITVIVGTANHFVLDALGGAAVFAAAVIAERELRRARERRDSARAIGAARLPAQRPEPVPAGHSEPVPAQGPETVPARRPGPTAPALVGEQPRVAAAGRHAAAATSAAAGHQP